MKRIKVSALLDAGLPQVEVAKVGIHTFLAHCSHQKVCEGY